MRTDLLLKLADFLETVPEERFDIEYWVGEQWQGKSDLSCGAPACSMGWASTIPEFAEMGLKLVRGGNSTAGYIAYQDESDIRACAKFFDIQECEARWLFLARGKNACTEGIVRLPLYATPKDAAEHLRKFVRGELK